MPACMLEVKVSAAAELASGPAASTSRLMSAGKGSVDALPLCLELRG